MPKASTKPHTRAGDKAIALLLPWSCIHHADRSEIEGSIPATGDRGVIAAIPQTAGIDAEATAECIIRVVNGHEKVQALMRQMVTALELCLTCKGLTWEAEQEADIVLARASQGV